jgi:hypothetical protein
LSGPPLLGQLRGLQHEEIDMTCRPRAIVIEAAVLSIHPAPELVTLVALSHPRAHPPTYTADLDFSVGIGLQVERPRGSALVTGVRANHDKALTVGDVQHSRRPCPSGPPARCTEEKDGCAPDPPEHSAAAGAVQRHVQLATQPQRGARNGHRETRKGAVARHRERMPHELRRAMTPHGGHSGWSDGRRRIRSGRKPERPRP